MTDESFEPAPETLGQFLQNTRTSLGYDFDQICSETRISRSNLIAMESDNYQALPADAFARGFYNIYAKVLGLDPEEIIARFLAERGSTAQGNKQAVHNPPARKAQKQVGNMAEPSGVSPLSTIGLALLLLIIIGAGVCWYFDINPATFISEKLRGLQSADTTEVIPADDGEKKEQSELDKDGSQQNGDRSTSSFQAGGAYFTFETNSAPS